MRKPIIAGNWKMNKTIKEGLEFIEEVKGQTEGDVEVLVCAPFTLLKDLKLATKGTNIKIGAQNMHYENAGAFTGEVAPANLVEIGMDYVIIGHSERREYYGETDETCNKKVLKAIEVGIDPILCCGETLEEREADKTMDKVKGQIVAGLAGVKAEDLAKVVIAYEPIWAIGTGKTATAEQAQEIHAFIRSLIAEKYGKEVADNTSILYGGSCKPSNAKELFANPDVDGGLIGGAALKVADFKGIIDAFK